MKKLIAVQIFLLLIGKSYAASSEKYVSKCIKHISLTSIYDHSSSEKRVFCECVNYSLIATFGSNKHISTKQINNKCREKAWYY